MPSSDSEDFESADEGQGNVEKHGRKKRQSSSNYSDSTLESDSNAKKPSAVLSVKKVESKPAAEEPTDGWDDFDIEEETSEDKNNQSENDSNVINKKDKTEEIVKSQDTGWDDFGDWGQDEKSQPQKEQPQQAKSQTAEQDVKSITDQMDRMGGGTEGWPTWSGGWGWGGWGVDSLLTTATAGISTLTSQVSQGISTALETGIGAPDPEQLARQTAAGGDQNPRVEATRANVNWNDEEARGTSEAFPFGSLLSGVTKFVESTGTKVIAGGLDTLETIGKKTMEVLQDGDPGLAKKRAMLGLDSGDKPVLSQLLREAKSKADEEDRVREEKREAKEVHYENLFDDFEGLVHLEALEMLSKQVQMRIEERLRGVDPDKRQDIKETLQQVSELCEMPEEEEEDEDIAEGSSKPDAFLERLQTATQDIGIKIQFQPLVKHYSELLNWPAEELTDKAVYKRAVSGLAQATALSVELYHKTAEMLLVNTRRSTADEADALTQMTVVLTKHISELANWYTEKLNAIQTENKEQLNTYITNIFLEAGNSSTYIQNAFQLALPILQIGAV